MRKLLSTSLALAATRRSPSSRRRRPQHDPRRPAAIPGCAKGSSTWSRTASSRSAPTTLPSRRVRRRREDEAVEGLRSVQRQGRGVRGRLRGREAARLHEGPGEVDGRAVQQLLLPGRQAVRPLPHAGLLHARSAEVRRLPGSYYFVNQSVVGRKGQPIARAKSVAALRPFKLGVQVGTTSYYITRYIRPSSRPPRLRHERRRGAGAQERADRRDRGRPADRVLRHRCPGGRRRDRRQAADAGHEGALRDGPPEGELARGCVNRALDRLWANGTIKRLQTTYLARAGAPDIK